MQGQLRDIDGLDAIGWWPLASGWWLSLLVLLTVMLIIGWWWQRRGLTSWQLEGRQQLGRLKSKSAKLLADDEWLNEFSELLRRVAMARCGREQCASLCGQDWLDFLQSQDPKGFRWSEQAAPLANLYHPQTPEISAKQRKKLTKAAQAWCVERSPWRPWVWLQKLVKLIFTTASQTR